MGIFGEPDAELKDLLAEVDAIQQAARRPIRNGARGGDVYAAVEPLTRGSPHGNSLEFVAHGMGLISHEAPRLTNRAPVPYPAYDADLPLQKGMVLSIETTILHPRRGFIKLEDTVAVTEGGLGRFRRPGARLEPLRGRRRVRRRRRGDANGATMPARLAAGTGRGRSTDERSGRRKSKRMEENQREKRKENIGRAEGIPVRTEGNQKTVS